MKIRFPDPEFAETFRAYRNYVEDLAGCIGGQFGVATSLVCGVHDAVLSHPPVARVSRRPLSDERRQATKAALQKTWGWLHRMSAEIEDPYPLDEEANAWLPVMSYYAVFHALLAYAAASGQAVPRDHTATRRLAAKEVKRGVFPYPWSAWCEGCPQTGKVSFGGGLLPDEPVHVLSNPDPATSEARLAMFLRTTRQKELEQRFAEERHKKITPGRSRRNLSKQVKEHLATSMAPTTVFNLFWRMRVKANYEDADVFVLGAEHELDARRFGAGLVIVTDTTVAALEALIAAYVGPRELAIMANSYQGRRYAPTAQPLPCVPDPGRPEAV